jgi:ABC-type polysaccharide/polyol phosphate transport system ATPase subunit
LGEIVIRTRSLSKTFAIPVERRDRLKERVLRIQRPRRRLLEALRDIDLDIERGEFFGVIGSNGSGKSTLLKLIAGIYRPTSGTLGTVGRVSSFIELGVGFNPELTARENVFLGGAILGLRRREVATALEQIVAFAELEGFMEQKVKNFSSGMVARLAFSIAIRPDADILLVDEVLAVGDEEFQRKCFDVFRRLKDARRTVVFVSHDLDALTQIADRVLVLDQGRSLGTFAPREAIDAYRRGVRALDAPAERVARDPRLPTIREISLQANGRPSGALQRGDDVDVVVLIDNPNGTPIHAGISILTGDHVYCFGTNTCASALPPSTGLQVEARAHFPQFPLQRGTYHVTAGVFGETTERVYEMRERALTFVVDQGDASEGLVNLRHEWDVRAR